MRKRRARKLWAFVMLAVASTLLVTVLTAFIVPSVVEGDDPFGDEIEIEAGSFGAPTSALEVKLIDVDYISGANDALMAPFGTRVLSISDEGIQIYWKKIEGAAGYEVARVNNNTGEPEHLAYVSRGTYNYTDPDFDHELHSVTYLVRGLSEADGIWTAGPWSEPIEAQYIESIQLSRSLWYLPSGDSFTFEAAYGWSDLIDAEWSSSDDAVATVDQSGTVYAVAQGEATITCTSPSLGQSAELVVVVDRSEQPMLDETPRRFAEGADGVWSNPSAEVARNAVITMAGDLMCMGPQLTTHYTDESGYEFNGCYDYVRQIFTSSDLAVANLETMVASAYPYNGESGYVNGKPVCNAPARYLDAVRWGGIDAFCIANNHNSDMGVRGVEMTLDQIDRYGFARTGLFESADEERTLLVDVNGIKVGFIAYVDETCGYNGQDESWTDEQRNVTLNWYSAERAAADIAHLRERGAEYIIAYPHWGVKNYFSPVEGQVQTAHELAEMGVNYIVGSHPHLIQRYECIITSDGRKVPCVYSVGDFNSYINQVEGNLDSIIVRIRLHRTNDGRVILAENAYIPCHIYEEFEGESYVTVPLHEALNGGVYTPDADVIRQRIAEQVGYELPMYDPYAL